MTRTLVAGVDFSTKEIHLVRRRQFTVAADWRRLTLEPFGQYAEKDALQARAAGQAIQEAPEWWDDVYLVGVEYPFTMMMATVVLKTIMGGIVASIPEHVTVLPLPARLWTPWFLRERPTDPLPKVPRKTADRKPLIKARALAMLDAADRWPQDAYDAFGISWAAEQMNAAGQRQIRPPSPGLKRPV